MRRRALLAAAFLSCLGGASGCGPSRDRFEQVYNGMLQEQVYQVLGAPKAVDARQWVYEPGLFHSRIVIDFVDGRVSGKSWGEEPTTRPQSQPQAPAPESRPVAPPPTLAPAPAPPPAPPAPVPPAATQPAKTIDWTPLTPPSTQPAPT